MSDSAYQICWDSKDGKFEWKDVHVWLQNGHYIKWTSPVDIP